MTRAIDAAIDAALKQYPDDPDRQREYMRAVLDRLLEEP